MLKEGVGTEQPTSTAENSLQKVAGSCAALAASCQRQGCRHAHDEEKAGHDQVCQVQPVPWRMRNPFRLLSHMVNEQHQCHSAPPGDVQASEPACKACHSHLPFMPMADVG